MERLLSAYRSKFQKRSDNTVEWQLFYKRFFPQIVQQVRHRKSDLSSQVTFSEFLQFVILTASKTSTTSDHWDTYEKICHFCAIDYDFVGNFDTLKSDVALVLRNLYENEEDFWFPNVTKPRSTPKLEESFYKSVPSDVIEKINKVFQLDYHLFNFSSTIR